MLIVQKYGGSSVANAERVFNVAKRIMRTRMEGNDVVVVLSAQGKTTDGLIAKAKEINAKPSRREMDMLLSTGEQQSVALMAMAISAIGGRAVSLNAAQVGIETTNTYSNARIRHINTERIENELDEGIGDRVPGGKCHWRYHHTGARRFRYLRGCSGGGPQCRYV